MTIILDIVYRLEIFKVMFRIHSITSPKAAMYFFSFLVSSGGVILSPLGTSATNWPLVPAPDDR
jgi:hypothetical protein